MSTDPLRYSVNVDGGRWEYTPGEDALKPWGKRVGIENEHRIGATTDELLARADDDTSKEIFKAVQSWREKHLPKKVRQVIECEGARFSTDESGAVTVAWIIPRETLASFRSVSIAFSRAQVRIMNHLLDNPYNEYRAPKKA